MDVSSMLSVEKQDASVSAETRRQHQYPTRNGSSAQEDQENTEQYTGNGQRSLRANHSNGAAPAYARGSPAKRDQKHVVFQLVDPQDPRITARLPMRVMISPHDTTDSIITTVKNFYGLYEHGVSFENKQGYGIIAAYNNFENDMTVYVRTTFAQSTTSTGDAVRGSPSPKKPTLGAPFEMRPPGHNNNHSPSRSAARSAGRCSLSPQPDNGRRSASATSGGKPRPQRTKSKDSGAQPEADGYSSGDNENVSVTSSRRSKVEEIKAEITVDNIVEGGRRKRAFESSELPLFVPPQVPVTASISSTSPQRRSGPPNAASPYAFNSQHTFAYPLPSPHSFANGGIHAQPAFPPNPYQNGLTQSNRQLRGGRSSGASYSSHRNFHGGVLPTPDPTIGSVISDEDVALQLMRLGDPSAFSHGRTSTSTVDDALSGKAEAASSDEEEGHEEDEDEDEDEEGHNGAEVSAFSRYSKGEIAPLRKKQRLMNELPSDGTSGEEYDDVRDGTFSSDGAMAVDGQRKLSKPKSKSRTSAGPPVAKPGKPRSLPSVKTKKSLIGNAKVPMSPASLPSQSRKASVASTINFQHQLGADEEDLSSKPRCQRCRKSKKGCDRQRPCGRCKDAGIGIEGCISEDEGNGRKGRYGRHMGVTIKKAEENGDEASPPSMPAPALSSGLFLAPALPDKNKKRKR